MKVRPFNARNGSPLTWTAAAKARERSWMATKD